MLNLDVVSSHCLEEFDVLSFFNQESCATLLSGDDFYFFFKQIAHLYKKKQDDFYFVVDSDEKKILGFFSVNFSNGDEDIGEYPLMNLHYVYLTKALRGNGYSKLIIDRICLLAEHFMNELSIEGYEANELTYYAECVTDDGDKFSESLVYNLKRSLDSINVIDKAEYFC